MSTKPTVALSESPDSFVFAVNSVSFLNVNGGRYVEIDYGITGRMSVRLEQDDAVASLFASADAEFEHARAAMRRAIRMRNTAWKLSRERAGALSCNLVCVENIATEASA